MLLVTDRNLNERFRQMSERTKYSTPERVNKFETPALGIDDASSILFRVRL